MRYYDITGNQKVFEIFNSRGTWEWTHNGLAAVEGHFKVLDTSYHIDLQAAPPAQIKKTTIDLIKANVWTVEFGQSNQTADTQYAITGNGSASQVFSTVIHMLREFATLRKVTAYRFLAKEPSRIALYDTMSRRLGTKIYNSTSREGEKIYIVVL